MENQEYACYEVKLNRLFNIQNKTNLIFIVLVAVSSAAYLAVQMFSAALDWKEILFVAIGDVILISVILLSHPKVLDVTPDTVKFRRRGALLHLVRYGHVSVGSNSESTHETTYTVYHIQSIEYWQTSFEKVFSCGHIRICGEVNTGAKGKQFRTFTIYGVKDFENTAAWMKEYIRLTNDQ